MHRAEKYGNPLRDVLHQDADTIAGHDAFARKRLLDGGDFSQDVRITVLFDTVLMIHRERETVRKPLRPFFDAIEDPCWLRKLDNGRPRNLGQAPHTEQYRRSSLADPKAFLIRCGLLKQYGSLNVGC